MGRCLEPEAWRKQMEREIFTAIMKNDEEHYMKTMESLIKSRPEVFYDVVLSAGGKIYVFDFISATFSNKEYVVIVKADLFFCKKRDSFLRVRIKIYINKPDLIEIAPYVLNTDIVDIISKSIKKETNVNETKEGPWFDKIIKGRKVEIEARYERPYFWYDEANPKSLEEFFGEILMSLMRMQNNLA